MCCWELSLSLKSSKFRWSQCFSKYSDSQSARTTRSQKAGKALGVGIPQGQIQDFFWRGCTRLLLYFNTNKPHSFFCRMPAVLENCRSSRGGGGVSPAPFPQIHPCTLTFYSLVTAVVPHWFHLPWHALQSFLALSLSPVWQVCYP